MTRRYERTQYVDTDTGAVMTGEAAFRRYLSENGVTRFSRRGERTTSYTMRDGVEYVSTVQEFRIVGVMERLNLQDKKD